MAKYNDGKIVTVPLTLDTDAYEAGDVLHGLVSVDISNFNDSAMLRAIELLEDGSNATSTSFYFFDSEPSTIADDAAFAPAWADMQKLIPRGVVTLSDYTAINSINYAMSDEINLDVVGDTLRFYTVTNGTPTYGATDVVLRLSFWLDGTEE
jgi:hypothetical protein